MWLFCWLVWVDSEALQPQPCLRLRERIEVMRERETKKEREMEDAGELLHVLGVFIHRIAKKVLQFNKNLIKNIFQVLKRVFFCFLA